MYKELPNKNHKFIVKAVYKHCRKNKYDKNNWYVVIQDTTTRQIYLIGELGLKIDEVETIKM